MLRVVAAAMHLRIVWRQGLGPRAAHGSLLLRARGCAAHGYVEQLGPPASQRLCACPSCCRARRVCVRREDMETLLWDILRPALILTRGVHILAGAHNRGYDGQAEVGGAAI